MLEKCVFKCFERDFHREALCCCSFMYEFDNTQKARELVISEAKVL
jgi:hypothetical protein